MTTARKNNRTDITNEMVVDEYRRLGNIWKVAESLGISGQTVANRLAKAGVQKKLRPISDDERKIIRDYYVDTSAEDFDLKELSARIGRTVPLISRTAREMGISNRRRPIKQQHREKMLAGTRRMHAEGRHPRGMLGKKHSEEVKTHLAQQSKRMWNTHKTFGIGLMSEEARRRRSDLSSARMAARAASTIHTRAAGGRRDDLGDIWFRSSWEANYARYLNLLMKLGIVVEWKYEPQTFWFEAIKRGVRSYLPDFVVVYKNDPVPVYVEVKGWVQAKDHTKWKRMKKYHPHIRLEIVGKKEYEAIKRKWSSAIPFWEDGKKRANVSKG